MKFFLSLSISCFFTCLVFSQNEVINKFYHIPKEINCIGSVKRVSLDFINKSNDTIKSFIVADFFNNKIEKVRFRMNAGEIWIKQIEFDSLERLKAIKTIKKEESQRFVEQFFSSNNKYSDSILIYRNNQNIEKYINFFEEDRVVKQSHFYNDILDDWKEYTYDNKGRLVKKRHIFPENLNGELLTTDNSNGNISTIFYPLDKVEYKYSKSEDTLITVIFKEQLGTEEIIKEFVSDDIIFKSITTYKDKELFGINTIFKIKDSVSDVKLFFEEGIPFRYYNTYKNKEGSVSKSKNHPKDNERIHTEKYIDVLDKKNNWIRREVYHYDKLSIIYIRKIEY